MKTNALVLTVVSLSCSQALYAGLFDTDKSKVEFSFGIENNISSTIRKSELSWDGIWHFENDKSPQLKFSSKPYYKYSNTKLQTAQERSTKIGLDAVKATYEIGRFSPYISVGAEQQEVETNNSTGNTTKKDNLTSIGYGLTYSLGNESGASITLYGYDKYNKFLNDKKSDESGIKLSLDLCKLLNKCKNK